GTSIARSPISVAVAPSSRCALRSTPRPTREWRGAMSHSAQINRRSFVIGTAAVGGLALGLDIPLRRTGVQAQAGTPEINAWVVIKPDDSIVVRVVRSEMG